MKIAILGWGSLVWNPSELKIQSNCWTEDGPLLPIEFARKSRGGRLTLIIYTEAQPIPTLWNISRKSDLEDAIYNLAKREGTTPKNIGFLIANDNGSYNGQTSRTSSPIILESIEAWIKEKRSTVKIDAAIWTDLTSDGFKPTKENVKTFIDNLSPSEYQNAETYVRKAPQQIKTRIRSFLEIEYKWIYDGSQIMKDWSPLKRNLEGRRIDKLDNNDYWVIIPDKPATFGHVVVISWKSNGAHDITDKRLFLDNMHMQKVMTVIHDLAFTMKTSLTNNGKKCMRVYVVSECETADFPFHVHLKPRFEDDFDGDLFLMEKELEESRWDTDGNEKMSKLEKVTCKYKQVFEAKEWRRTDGDCKKAIAEMKDWWDKHPFSTC